MPGKKKSADKSRKGKKKDEPLIYIGYDKESWEAGMLEMARKMEKGLSILVEWKCKKCRVICYNPPLGRVPDCPKCKNPMVRRDKRSLKELGVE